MKSKKEQRAFIVFDTPKKKTEFSKWCVARGLIRELEENEQDLKDLSYMNILKRLFGYGNLKTRESRKGLMTWIDVIIPNVDKNKLDYYELKRLLKLSYEKSVRFIEKLPIEYSTDI